MSREKLDADLLALDDGNVLRKRHSRRHGRTSDSAVGYWEQQGDQYFVSDTRNELRLPRYARLDVRLSRAFTRRASRISLFVEVLNVLDRENVRFTPPGVNLRTGQAFGLFESMIPRVPSAGVLVEF